MRGKKSKTASSGPSGTTASFDGCELVLGGRAKTELGNLQGDHVTSLAMIMRGFTRVYRHLIIELREHDDTNARRNRNKVIRFAAILARAERDVDTERNLGLKHFLSQINRFYYQYNLHRVSKSEMTRVLTISNSPEVVAGYNAKQLKDILNVLKTAETSEEKAEKLSLLFKRKKADFSDLDDDFLEKLDKEDSDSMKLGLVKIIQSHHFPTSSISSSSNSSSAQPSLEESLSRLAERISERITKLQLDYATQTINSYEFAVKEKNGALINTLSANLARAGMDYYNGLAGIAYLKIKKKPDSPNPKINPNEVNCEQFALKALDETFYSDEKTTSQPGASSAEEDNNPQKRKKKKNRWIL